MKLYFSSAVSSSLASHKDLFLAPLRAYLLALLEASSLALLRAYPLASSKLTHGVPRLNQSGYLVHDTFAPSPLDSSDLTMSKFRSQALGSKNS